ncbi:MAG: hypothetical protein ACYTFK_09890 [Planctomycetota bacterium]|jgi:hypothetical protein
MKKLIMFSMLIAIAVPILSGIASANVPACITICPPGAGPDDLITLTAYDEEGEFVDLSLWTGGVEMNFHPLDVGDFGFYFTAESDEMVNGTIQIVLGEERYGNPNWDFFTWSDHEEDDAEIQIAGNGEPSVEEVVAAGGTGDCVGIGCTIALPAITVDSNDLPVHEEQDAGGPATAGPAEGQLLVSLGWRPGESLAYPDFTATVTVDPNVGSGLHEDFVFTDSVAADGSVTLTFDQTNWDVPQQVVVDAVEDLDREGPEVYPIELTVTIDIADPNFGYSTPVVVGSTVSVADNDVPSVLAYPEEFELYENDPCTCVDLKVRLSHLPTDDVYVRIFHGGWGLGEDDRPIMASLTPPVSTEGISDPNFLTFTVTGNATWNESTMTSNWDVEQTITICPIDNDELTEPWEESIECALFLPVYSEDVRYRVPWFNAKGEEEEPSGGEAEEGLLIFFVNDNECGAVGYDPLDFNEDCTVGLADFAHFYAQWQTCTQPYDNADSQTEEDECDKLWNIMPVEEE